MVDLGFLKVGFYSAKECNQKLRTKKVVKFYSPFVCLTNIISNKTAVMEYLDLTVLLEYFNLTTQYVKSQKEVLVKTTETLLDLPLNCTELYLVM